MSKDIRSFFRVQCGSKQKLKTDSSEKKLVVSDDDDIPESPAAKPKNKEKLNKKRRIIDDSSDDEIPDKKLNKLQSKNGDGKNKDKKNCFKEVSAADMFGSDPIKRTNIKTKQSKNPSTEAEISIHSNEDFQKTLLQLDEPANAKNEIIKNKKGNNCIEHTKINRKNSTESPKVTSENLQGAKTEANLLNKTQQDESVTKTNGADLTLYKIPKRPISDVSESKSPDKNKSPVKKEKKRDFSEFLEIACENEQIRVDHTSPKSKKRKCDQSLNESAMSDEERFEKRRHSAMLYKNYLNRTGPPNPGSKVIPEGAPNCLKDLTFVLTGVLTSFEREEIIEAIQKYGGTVKSGVSRKVTHVLAGNDAGPAKVAKAQDLELSIINEDQFLQLIVQQPGAIKLDQRGNSVTNEKNIKNGRETGKEKQSKSETNVNKEKANKTEINVKKEVEKKTEHLESVIKIDKETKEKKTSHIKEKGPLKVVSFYKKSLGQNDAEQSTSTKEQPKELDSQDSGIFSDCKSTSSVSSDGAVHAENKSNSVPNVDTASLMWVEKYKPKTVKQIIGQNGDASIVKKLTNWLMRWYINRKEKLSKPSPWAKNDDGGYYKAALLSGPPGIGKTTTVSLVCAELGYDVVEFNASDTRSKTLVREQISELLTTTSLAGYVSGRPGRRALSKKHVLVMDEVDGMAGNEDRGGLQELISLIKLTSVPIVCMCNDRNSTKMRSLVNYCFDLRFTRPRVDQIKSAMMSVCFKEGVKIAPAALAELIVASNQDVRQTLNVLSMWAGATRETSTKRDMKLGPWEVVRKVFSSEEHKAMSIHDKSDLFFYDYSMAPLFVQENYLQVVPHCPKNEVLKRMSRTADSISLGDVVEAKIRGAGAWGLLPVQALYSSVLPGHAMAGHVAGQIQFPGWLGRNSRAGKMQRLAQEIHAHTRLSASGSKSSIFLDYCRQLRDAVVLPLVRDKSEGVARSLEVLQAYHLLREDLDSLGELALWPGQRDPMLLVDSKVKAAMTRAYNKESAALPYARPAVRRARGEGATEAEGAAEAEVEAEDEGAASDSDPESDAMIMKKKKTSQSSKQAAKPDTNKGKGKKRKGRE